MPRQGGMVVPNDDDVNNAQGSNPNDRERGGQASGSRRSVSEIILSEDEEEGNNIIPDTESVHGFTPDAVSNASGNSRRTSTPLRQQRVSTKDFGKRFYDSVNRVGLLPTNCQSVGQVQEVGVIEELDDVLLAAEIDPDSGPGHDVRILEHFMAVHKVPQRLIFISLSGEQMKMQCHTDATPVFLLRFQLTDGAVKVLRNLMESEECIAVLHHCNVHVSVMGSQFDLQACGTQLSTEKNQDVEIRILHPTFSSAKTLVGEILTGMEREFTKELCRAVSEARQAAHAVLAHRELIRKDRVIREEQDRQLRLSEEADRAKRLGARSGVSVEEESREDDAEDTLPDLDEGSHSKRPRVSDTGNELDDSGTVTFRPR